VVFRFGDHVLDIELRELRRGAELIALEPQVFDLLTYLVRNRGRVVSKDDLIDGGNKRSVLREFPSQRPLWIRTSPICG
jgi:DNA-binding winged helix-turn-helix (wHTH) protein